MSATIEAQEARMAEARERREKLREALENEGAPARRKELEAELRVAESTASTLHYALHSWRDAQARLDGLVRLREGLEQAVAALDSAVQDLPHGEARAFDLVPLAEAIHERLQRVTRRVEFLTEERDQAQEAAVAA